MRIPRLARVHLGPMAVLFVLALTACVLVAGLPRVTQGAFDQALRRALTGAPAVQADLAVTVESRSSQEDLHERAQFDTRDRLWHKLLPATLRPLVAPGGHMSAKTTLTPVTGSHGGRYLNLGWLSDADRRVDWVQGRVPGAPATMRYEGEPIPLIEVGVVAEAAAKMGLRPGRTVVLGENDQVAVKIVGLFEAKDPGDRYWSHNTDILHYTEIQPPNGGDMEVHTTTLMSDAGLTALSGAGRNLTYRWILPVNGAAASAQDTVGLGAAVADFGRLVTLQSTGTPYHLETGLPKLLGDFLAALATAQTVMYLVLGGLLAVVLGVIVLAVRLLTDRMDHALTVARARGGSLRQVAGTAAALTGLAVAPAALAGYALSYLVPGPVVPIVHLGPVLVVVASAGFAAARPAVTHRTPLHERRDDVVATRPSARRVTLEVLVVVLALGGAYLLRARGPAASAGQDPFLLVVPVTLTLAAAVITLRCYPYPLRLLVRLTARGRAAVPFLGLTRAARARSGSVLPVLILLPALAVSVFAAVISDGIAGTQRLASWEQAGAPIRITSPMEIPAAQVERVRGAAGVDRVLLAQTGRVQLGYGAERAEALAVDVGQWRELLGDAPVGLPPLSDGVLVSPELRGRGTLEIGWQSRLRLATRGVIDSVPGFYTQGKFLVVPLSVQARPYVNTLLVSGDASPAALRRLVPQATVVSQAETLAAIQDDPLTSTVRWTLLVVTVALAGYALVAIVLALVVGAAERARAVSFLRTLGLSERQAQRLTVLEILPMIIITALAGLGLGLLLPAALGPGVDLSSYAGGLPVGDYALDLLTPSVLAAGLAAVAVLGAYTHTAIGRRRALGAVLRLGDLS
ncbi:FtsX-like permease family protein [Nonomuraea jiangxiensis]|uniref:FtsX-like permease family protein n=1 Tax=Nonomuraea jiangxiensis TaxID=633440 RepID=A0A1G7YFK4_9ACTN|nr:FtsX-like permease family protein [Nonomuraea jiangxiensis]SDG95117.1 FtsX-like permease family protein [Nonomuraea jiangxiensis]